MSASNGEREIILARSLDDIQSGRSTVADCLIRYPQYREYLAEMLPVAADLIHLPSADPRPAFRRQARARLMARITGTMGIMKGPAREKRGKGERPILWFFRRILSPVVIILLIPILLFFSGASLVSAAEKSLPGDPLYALDTALESLQFSLTWDSAGRMRLALDIVAERIAELQELTARGGSAEDIQQAVDGYERALLQTADVLSTSDTQGGRENLQDDIAKELSNHIQVLVSLRNRIPEKAGNALERAIEKSLQDETDLKNGSFGRPENQEKVETTKTPGKNHQIAPGKPTKEPSGNSSPKH